MPTMLPWAEIVLAVAALGLMMLGVFARGNPMRRVAQLVVLAFLVALAITIWMAVSGQSGVVFGGMYVTDRFSLFVKILVLIASCLAVIMSQSYIERESMARFEFPLLMLFATLSMMMMI